MGSLRRDRNPLISDDIATNTLFWLLLGQIGSAIFGSICQLRPSNLCSAIGSTVRSAVDSVFSRKTLIPFASPIKSKNVVFGRSFQPQPAAGAPVGARPGTLQGDPQHHLGVGRRCHPLRHCRERPSAQRGLTQPHREV
jgi:hypothetical protein